MAVGFASNQGSVQNHLFHFDPSRISEADGFVKAISSGTSGTNSETRAFVTLESGASLLLGSFSGSGSGSVSVNE
jgi:hypothetical protein